MKCDMITGFMINAAGDGPGAEIECQNEATIEDDDKTIVCPSCALALLGENLLMSKGKAALACFVTAAIQTGGRLTGPTAEEERAAIVEMIESSLGDLVAARVLIREIKARSTK